MTISKIHPIRPFPLSRTLSLDVGVLHFVGIGGIGMSGIAEILHNLGYRVQGSDMSQGANVDRLREMGIAVTIGHQAANLKDAAVVVISSAVKMDNPEVIAAREQRIPVVKRAEMLAELMRLKMSVAVAGTHGKTTTTSLCAALFDAAGKQPTVINGGIINAYGTNARLGSGEWMVVEADESDGTFIKLPSTIAIVTNIDPEHLDYYGDFAALRAAFRQFIENLPFYGFGVMCIDHAEVQALMAGVTDRRIISYGISPQADVRGMNIRIEPGGQRFDVEIERPGASPHVLRDVFLPMHGLHNLRNALAVIGVGDELVIGEAMIKSALANFRGVKRRFTKTGEAMGVTIIDDYGHHPVEIAATLKAARQVVDQRADGRGQRAEDSAHHRVIAVVQPHRYTRLRDLFKDFCACFNEADAVVVADVYSAGEEAIKGISRDTLVEGLRASGHKQVFPLEHENALPALLAEMVQPGDMVVCLGAGSITKWAYTLPDELEAAIKARGRASA